MKHLDVVDGVIGAISLEARPPSGVIGDNIELLILHLRMPDAETWIAHTATHAVLRLEEQQIQDYLLISNGLMHRTPCVFSIKEETVIFFPPVWPIRTRHGPYNCVSSEKQ